MDDGSSTSTTPKEPSPVVSSDEDGPSQAQVPSAASTPQPRVITDRMSALGIPAYLQIPARDAPAAQVSTPQATSSAMASLLPSVELAREMYNNARLQLELSKVRVQNLTIQEQIIMKDAELDEVKMFLTEYGAEASKIQAVFEAKDEPEVVAPPVASVASSSRSVSSSRTNSLKRASSSSMDELIASNLRKHPELAAAYASATDRSLSSRARTMEASPSVSDILSSRSSGLGARSSLGGLGSYSALGGLGSSVGGMGSSLGDLGSSLGGLGSSLGGLGSSLGGGLGSYSALSGLGSDRGLAYGITTPIPRTSPSAMTEAELTAYAAQLEREVETGMATLNPEGFANLKRRGGAAARRAGATAGPSNAVASSSKGKGKAQEHGDDAMRRLLAERYAAHGISF